MAAAFLIGFLPDVQRMPAKEPPHKSFMFIWAFAEQVFWPLCDDKSANEPHGLGKKYSRPQSEQCTALVSARKKGMKTGRLLFLQL